MRDAEVVLTRRQREDIIKAVHAIERQLNTMGTQPNWQALYVIGTNLAIIKASVSGMPRVSSN
jgi:hypothetical protein